MVWYEPIGDPSDVTLAAWVKAENDPSEKGEVIAEIETEFLTGSIIDQINEPVEFFDKIQEGIDFRCIFLVKYPH